MNDFTQDNQEQLDRKFDTIEQAFAYYISNQQDRLDFILPNGSSAYIYRHEITKQIVLQKKL